MRINLYMIYDYLSFPAERHLMSNPVTRDLCRPAISGQNQLQNEVVYVMTPEDFSKIQDLSSKIRLVFTAPPLQDPRLETMDYLYASSPIEPIELLQELYSIFQKFNNWELNLYKAMLADDPLQILGDCSVEFLRNPTGLYTSSFYDLCNWEKRERALQVSFKKMTKEAMWSWNAPAYC